MVIRVDIDDSDTPDTFTKLLHSEFIYIYFDVLN